MKSYFFRIINNTALPRTTAIRRYVTYVYYNCLEIRVIELRHTCSTLDSPLIYSIVFSRCAFSELFTSFCSCYGCALHVTVSCLLLVTITITTTIVTIVVFCTTTNNYDQWLVSKHPNQQTTITTTTTTTTITITTLTITTKQPTNQQTRNCHVTSSCLLACSLLNNHDVRITAYLETSKQTPFMNYSCNCSISLVEKDCCHYCCPFFVYSQHFIMFL